MSALAVSHLLDADLALLSGRPFPLPTDSIPWPWPSDSSSESTCLCHTSGSHRFPHIASSPSLQARKAQRPMFLWGIVDSSKVLTLYIFPRQCVFRIPSGLGNLRYHGIRLWEGSADHALAVTNPDEDTGPDAPSGSETSSPTFLCSTRSLGD